MGRFTGVDPFIQSPLNSQSLNPYSYILNNPLSGTDPTGYVSINDISSLMCQQRTECDPTRNIISNDRGCGSYKACLANGQDGGESSVTKSRESRGRNPQEIKSEEDTFFEGHLKGIVDNSAESLTFIPLYILGFNQVDDYGEVYNEFDPRIFGGSDSSIGQLGYGTSSATVFLASLLGGKLMGGSPKAPKASGVPEPVYHIDPIEVRAGPAVDDIADVADESVKPTVPYSRKLYGGSQTNSKPAEDLRRANEGKPCPTCGNDQVSGTSTAPSPQHDPTLVRHYYEHGGHKMTDAQRREYASSSKAFNGTQCLTCQRKEGAAEARYSMKKSREYGLDEK